MGKLFREGSGGGGFKASADYDIEWLKGGTS